MKRLFFVFMVLIFLTNPVKASAIGTSATGAILINGDTGSVIYEQNAYEKLPMASTTKIMTALLLCENADLEKEITVTDEMVRVEGSSMGLLPGDRVTFHDLLYGMLLASGNDAANTTAISIGGSVDGFVKMMNQKASQLGLKDTSFQTPSGLDGDNHYTTARDLAILARYAMQNESFYKAASSQSAVLNYGNPPYRRSLTNHNKLLQSFNGAVGVKTGFTKKSGRCLVSAAKRDGKYVIAVTLRDPNDWADHACLLEYGLNQLTPTNVSPQTSNYTVKVLKGVKEEILLEIKPITLGLGINEDISCKVKLPKKLPAPVRKGQKIGYVHYLKNGEIIKTVDILSPEDIAKRKIEKTNIDILEENLKYIFLSIWEK